LRRAEARADALGAVLLGQRVRHAVATTVERAAVGRLEADGAWRALLQEAVRTGSAPRAWAAALGRARLAAKHGYDGWAVGVVEAALRAEVLDAATRAEATQLQAQLSERVSARVYAQVARERAAMTLEKALDAPDGDVRREARRTARR
ncbi:MAG: hypothetical protein WD336_11120, partial [Trueperaceae bacterium]